MVLSYLIIKSNMDGGRPLYLTFSDPLLLLCRRPPRWVIHPPPCCLSFSARSPCFVRSLSHCVIHYLMAPCRVVHHPMAIMSSTAGLPCVTCRQIAPRRPPLTCLVLSTTPSCHVIQPLLAPHITYHDLIVAFILSLPPLPCHHFIVFQYSGH